MRVTDLLYLGVTLVLFAIVFICPIRNSTSLLVVDRFLIASKTFDFIKTQTYTIPVFVSPLVLNVRAGVMTIDPTSNKIKYIDSSGNAYPIDMTNYGMALPFLMLRFR
jgi:hypothetical protein